ncbi:hypothetical protein U1Q18_030883 [Sarracenia purpurea var. burkii]
MMDEWPKIVDKVWDGDLGVIDVIRGWLGCADSVVMERRGRQWLVLNEERSTVVGVDWGCNVNGAWLPDEFDGFGVANIVGEVSSESGEWLHWLRFHVMSGG